MTVGYTAAGCGENSNLVAEVTPMIQKPRPPVPGLGDPWWQFGEKGSEKGL